MILELKNVVAGYGNRPILEDVNLTIKSGDFIGVVGPNGGGKTTLIKTVLGLVTPMAGTIKYGYDITPSDHSHRIGYLPQINNIDKTFPISAIDVVLTGLVSRANIRGVVTKRDRVRATELMEDMDISNIINSPIGELSGGQMQRVFLCRSLINDPKLLILDEPTTYIDNNFSTVLYDKLKELNRSITIILVSHDLGTITSHVKSIICVNRSVHYHDSNIVNEKILKSYNCPIQLISHGNIPHTVLKNH